MGGQLREVLLYLSVLPCVSIQHLLISHQLEQLPANVDHIYFPGMSAQDFTALYIACTFKKCIYIYIFGYILHSMR